MVLGTLGNKKLKFDGYHTCYTSVAGPRADSRAGGLENANATTFTVLTHTLILTFAVGDVNLVWGFL